MTATTVVKNATFAHLNDDRTSRIKQQTSSIEREIVADITIGSTVTYTTGGITIDFTQVGMKTFVYYCDIIHNGYILPVKFVPATGNAAATGKLMFYDNTGVELGAGSVAAESAAIRVIIRGV